MATFKLPDEYVVAFAKEQGYEIPTQDEQGNPINVTIDDYVALLQIKLFDEHLKFIILKDEIIKVEPVIKQAQDDAKVSADVIYNSITKG